MTSARRVRFRQRANCNLCTHFVTVTVIFELVEDYDSKHQLILPPAHHLAKLIIMNEHLRLLHVGAFEIKGGNTRSKTTKAIHLELVSNLTSEAFIAKLKCFIARRGLVDHLYTDSGSNFIGANRELKAFFKSEEFLRQVHSCAVQTQFQWHFIPPNSPHFGGLWGAGVKSLKYHWKRIVGEVLLTFEEFSTLITQIETCFKSRPLIALSSDPNDPSHLSPGHFLIGAPLTTLPEPAFTSTTMNSLSRWQGVQPFSQKLWKRWSSDCLNSWQQHSKWRSKQPDLQPEYLCCFTKKIYLPCPGN